MPARLLRAATLAAAAAGLLAGPADAAPRVIDVPGVSAVDLADDGSLLAGTSTGKLVSVAPDGQVVGRYVSGLSRIYSVARRSDGRITATGDTGGSTADGSLDAPYVAQLTAEGQQRSVAHADDAGHSACAAIDPSGRLTISTAGPQRGPGHLRTFGADDQVISDVVLNSPRGDDFGLNGAGCARRAAGGDIVSVDFDLAGGPIRTYDAAGTLLSVSTADFQDLRSPVPFGDRTYVPDRFNRLSVLDAAGQLLQRTTLPLMGDEGPGFGQTLDINADGEVASAATGSTVELFHLRRPVAAIAPASASVQPGDTVRFDASGTATLFDSVARYEWDLDGDGDFETDTGTTPTVSHTFPDVGNATVRVRATGAGTGGQDVAVSDVAVGPVGVSVDAGARFTNDPRVTLSLVHPPGATQALISNDGGFAGARTVPVARTIDATLDATGAERLPKTVYVRFLGPGTGPETYQDDIVLDQTAPRIDSAAVSRQGVVSVVASDATSGVSRLRVASRAGEVELPYAESVAAPTDAPVALTAIDAAGNRSAPVVVAPPQPAAATTAASTPIRLTLAPRLGRVRLAAALRRGIVLTPGCSARCTVTATATIGRRAAIARGLLTTASRVRSLAVARATGTGSALRLRFTPRATRVLRSARRVVLRVTVTARGATTVHRTVAVTLRR